MTRSSMFPLFLLGVCSLINLYSTQPVLTHIADWSGYSPASAAWTISATTLGVALCAPFSGAVSDVYGRKRILVSALAVLAVITALCALSPHFYILLFLRFLQGLATPFIFTVAVAYIAEECVEKSRSNSLYVAGTAFGGFIGRLLSGLVSDSTGSWRLSFYANVLVLLFTLLIVLKFLPVEENFVPTGSVRNSISGLGAHLRDPFILGSCCIAFMLLFQQVSTFTFGSLHLMGDEFRLSSSAISWMFAVFLLPSFITPYSGRLIATKGRNFTFALATALTISGLIISLFNSVSAVIFGLACSCIAVFVGQSCGTSFVGTYAKSNKSAAIGLYTFSYYLGGAFGAVVPQPAYSIAGWKTTVFIVIAFAVVSTLLSRRYWKVV